MAMQEVQHIMEILKDFHGRQMQQKELQQQRDRDDSAAANRLAEQDARDRQFQEEVKQHEVTNKAAKAMLDLQIQAHRLQGAQVGQQMGQQYQETGVAPTGSTMQPMAHSVNGDFSPMNPQQATSQMMTIPGVDNPIQVATPEAAAARRANLDEILAAPKRATEASKQQAETDRMIAVTKATQGEETKRFLAQIDKTQAGELEREKLRIAGENARNALTTATQLKIANLPYAIFNNMDPKTRAAVTQPSIDGLMNGTMSAKQVQQEFAEKGMAGAGTAVISSFMSTGAVPPTDKQVQFIQKVKPIVDAVPLIHEYISLLPKTTGGPSGLYSGLTHPDFLNPRLAAIEKELEFNIAPVARTLGGDEGQRLQKALLGPAEGGYMPNKSKPTTYNVQNANKFLQVLNSAIDAQLGSLTPAQRAHIKNELGLTKISQLSPTGTPLVQASPSGNSSPIHKYYDAQGNETAGPGGK